MSSAADVISILKVKIRAPDKEKFYNQEVLLFVLFFHENACCGYFKSAWIVPLHLMGNCFDL